MHQGDPPTRFSLSTAGVPSLDSASNPAAQKGLGAGGPVASPPADTPGLRSRQEGRCSSSPRSCRGGSWTRCCRPLMVSISSWWNSWMTSSSRPASFSPRQKVNVSSVRERVGSVGRESAATRGSHHSHEDTTTATRTPCQSRQRLALSWACTAQTHPRCRNLAGQPQSSASERPR